MIGRHFVLPRTEWRAFDGLPRSIREVFARAPFKYAIAPRAKGIEKWIRLYGLAEAREDPREVGETVERHFRARRRPPFPGDVAGIMQATDAAARVR